MIRLSIIAIYLSTFFISNCEDIKLYQSGSELFEECQTRINVKEYSCKLTISSQWGCRVITTTKQLDCNSLAQKCCASHQITECVKPEVRQLCGEHMVDRYVDLRRNKSLQCQQRYSYGSEVCAESRRRVPHIKRCYAIIIPKERQCISSAARYWNCTPSCSNDVRRECCWQWQYYDCVTGEARNNCDDFVFKQVFTPSHNSEIKTVEQRNCRNYTYGSIQCQTEIITSSTKSAVSPFPEECQTQISDKEMECSETISSEWRCDLNTTILVCNTDTQRCCASLDITECVTPKVEELCGEHMVASYVHHRRIMFLQLRCLGYTSDYCERYRIVPKGSVTTVSVTPSQTTPNGTDNESDSTRRSSLTQNTTPHVINDTKKSEQKKPWNIVIIVVVILLLLIIIGAILVICCGLCKTRKKSEDITETQQSEHNQQNNGETGEEEGKSAEESATLRTNNSSSVVASDNESDSQLDQTVK